MIGIDPRTFTLRQLWRMARGRLQSQWAQQASVIRAMWLCSMQPQEPPLAAFIPAEYVPANAKGRELTDEEKELVRKKQELDLRITQGLAGKGIKVKRGTPRE